MNKIQKIITIFAATSLLILYFCVLKGLLHLLLNDSFFFTFLEILITTLLIFIILRGFGTYVTYPGSFKITKNQIQASETELTIKTLQQLLGNLISSLHKLQEINYENLSTNCYMLYCRGVPEHFRFINYFFRQVTLTNRKLRLKQLYQELEFIFGKSGEERIDLGNILHNPDMCKTVSEIDLRQLKEKGRNCLVVIEQILRIFQTYYNPAQLKKSKTKYTKWKLWHEKFFPIEAYYAYWHYNYHFYQENIKTFDNNDIQSAVITNFKNQETNHSKAVLFSNPNGVFIQILGLGGDHTINFYLQKGYQVILWNYRGYGTSTGTPSVRKCQKDAETVYNYYKGKLQIEIVHGFSIGGACAIYLAKRYKEIKLLVADRTFSRLDHVHHYLLQVGQGFFEWYKKSSSEFRWNLLKQFCRTITKTLFYSDCILLSDLYLQVDCKKIIIWDRKDEIIVNASSIKQHIIHNLFCLSPDSAKDAVETQEDITKQQSEQKISQISEFENESVEDYNKRMLSIFTSSLLQLMEEKEDLRGFLEAMEDIDGGGNYLFKKYYFHNSSLTDNQIRQFKEDIKDYLMGLTVFGSQSSYFSPNSKQHSAKLILERVEMVKGMKSKEMEIVLNILSFVGRRLLKQKVGREGYLLATDCGHNGMLSKKNYEYITDMMLQIE